MGTGVMGHELLSSVRVNCDMDLLSLVELKIALQWSVKGMKNTFSNLNSIDYLIFTSNSRECDSSIIMLLTTRSWVDSRFVENDDIWNLLLLDILEDINNGSVEFHHFVIFVV